jgi:magnesium transporter
MSRFIKSQKGKKERIPGDLVFIGRQKVEISSIHHFAYNEHEYEEKEISHPSQIEHKIEHEHVNWFDITGVHDSEFIKEIGKQFNLHPLTLEDIMDTGERSKISSFDDYISVTLKMMRIEEKDQKVHSEQFTCIIKDDIIITFQERKGDVFEGVRDRIRKQKGKIRTSHADYLSYALFDAIFNNYLLLIEILGSEIEQNEELVIENPSESLLSLINRARIELNFLQSHIRPSRDAIRELLRNENSLYRASTLLYIRDVLEIGTQAVETLENYRQMVKDQSDSLSASSTNKLNDVMKFLTVFSVIFIPLSFLVGLYGTNFTYMPELDYRYAYFIFLGVLVTVALFMVLMFKRKKWL